MTKGTRESMLRSTMPALVEKPASRPASPASAAIPKSTVARVAGAVGGAALGFAALGPVSTMLGVAGPRLGFALFAAGGAFALLAVLLGLVGLVRTRPGVRAGRRSSWVAVASGLAIVGLFLVAARPGRGLPRINDITTSPSDPPTFESATASSANPSADLSYPASFATLQKDAYPDLGPIHLSISPEEALRSALEAARSLGWDVHHVDASGRRFEATHTSKVFRFVDDIAVRVRPLSESGARVDVRSRSRLGKGDLGANARRIRAFREAIRAREGG